MLEGTVAGEEVREDKVAVHVREGELIVFGKLLCEWGRRWRGGAFYSLREQTLHVSIPAQLSRSLLRPSSPSIGSRTCVPTGSHSGARSS